MGYSQVGDRVVRDEDGYVAVKYYQTIPQTVSLGQKEYRFEVRANICMQWIPSEYVEKVLSITKTCCGGNKKHPYRLEVLDSVRRWTNGGGR